MFVHMWEPAAHTPVLTAADTMVDTLAAMLSLRTYLLEDGSVAAVLVRRYIAVQEIKNG